MHQDQRIGLALGILLVGACAAFFFRNETRSTSNTPRLQHAQELDDRIAERSTHPYLKGIQAVETSDRQRAEVLTAQRKSGESSGGVWSTVEPFSPRKSAESSTDRKGTGKVANDDGEVQVLAPIAVPDETSTARYPSTSSGDTESDAAGRQTHSKHPVQSPGDRVHVVQKGDTLSSISAKMLGSPNRFHEIFEANRDQLRDANDLKLGMSLRIPSGKTETATVPSATRSRQPAAVEPATIDLPPALPDPLNRAEPPAFETHSTPKPTETPSSPTILLPPTGPTETAPESPAEQPDMDDAVPTRKFVPARRTPVPGRPIGPQVKANGLREGGGRRLSQVSLESTSGKVAR